MNILTLTSNYNENKIQVRKDSIIAMESLEMLGLWGRNRTRIYLKGGDFRDVIEEIGDIKGLL